MKPLGTVTAYFNIEKIQTVNGIHQTKSLLMSRTRETHLYRTLNAIRMVKTITRGWRISEEYSKADIIIVNLITSECFTTYIHKHTTNTKTEHKPYY